MLSLVGTPDIVIKNAGYAHYLVCHEMSDADIVRQATVSLLGALTKKAESFTLERILNYSQGRRDFFIWFHLHSICLFAPQLWLQSS